MNYGTRFIALVIALYLLMAAHITIVVPFKDMLAHSFVRALNASDPWKNLPERYV